MILGLPLMGILIWIILDYIIYGEAPLGIIFSRPEREQKEHKDKYPNKPILHRLAKYLRR